jgi:hypothetical protein
MHLGNFVAWAEKNGHFFNAIFTDWYESSPVVDIAIRLSSR